MKKLLLFFAAIIIAQLSMAQCNELFISEYVEGSGNNKGVEIYNPTANSIDLSDYKVQRYSNGAGVLSDELTLSGTIQAYDVWVVVNGQITSSAGSPACDPTMQALADQLGNTYPDPMYMNGNDAIVLYKISTTSIVDIFGHTNDANMQTDDGWGAYGTSYDYLTKNHTLVRKSTVTQGVTVDPSPTFDPSLEWDSLTVDTWTELGQHTCDCFVSIDEKTKTTANVSLFPNPSATNYVFVNSTINIEEIEIINLLGSVVQQQFVTNNTLSYQVAFNQNIVSGIYFVKVRMEGNIIRVQKLIIK